jgi:hypothetical protein
MPETFAKESSARDFILSCFASLLCVLVCCVLFFPLNFIDFKSPLERFSFPTANLQQIYLYLDQISVRCECMTSTCLANLQHDKEENKNSDNFDYSFV